MLIPPTALRGPASVTFLGSAVDAADLATYTFSIDLGAAGAYERIYAIFVTRGAGAINSASIGGVTATLHHTGTNSIQLVGLTSARFVGGGIQNVSVTFDGTTNRAGVMVWGANNLVSYAPISSAAPTADPTTTSINVPSGGIVIMGAITAANTSATATELTENADSAIEATSTMWGGSKAYATAQSGLTVGCDFATVLDTASSVNVFR